MSVLERLKALVTADIDRYIHLSEENGRGAVARLLDAFIEHVRRSETAQLAAPWFWRDQPSDIRRLHETAIHYHPARLSMAARCLYFIAWPFVMTAIAGAMLARNGRTVAKRYGVSRSRQLWQMLSWGLRRNVPPSDYYVQRLFQIEDKRIPLFFFQREMYGIFEATQPENPHTHIANDKWQFEAHCRQHGLPTPYAIARFGCDTESWADGAPGLPRIDLFRKPQNLSCGRGAQRWVYQDGPTPTWRFRDDVVTEAAFIEACREDSQEDEYLVQPALTNAPEIKQFAPNALSTFRVTTLLLADGPVILSAVARLPTGAMILDNFSAGGLISNVDPETGVMSAAKAKDVRRGVMIHHPDTKAEIASHRLSVWDEVKQMVLKAHRTLPGLTSVGWDVAATTDGVKIIEANIGWNGDLIQLAADRSLGETIFVSWACEQLQQELLDAPAVGASFLTEVTTPVT